MLLLTLCTPFLYSAADSIPQPTLMPPNSFWLPDPTMIGVTVDVKPTDDPTYNLPGSTGFRFTMTVNGVSKPTPVLVLQRGTNYTFYDNSDYAVKSNVQFDQHPLYIADATSIGQGSGVQYPGAPNYLQNNGIPTAHMTLLTEGLTAQQKAMCGTTTEVAALVKLNYQCLAHAYMGGVGAKILIVPSGWTYDASDLDPGASAPTTTTPTTTACNTAFQVNLLSNYKVTWKVNKGESRSQQ